MVRSRRRLVTGWALALGLAVAAAACSGSAAPAGSAGHAGAPAGTSATAPDVGTGVPGPDAAIPDGLLTPAQIRTAYDLPALYRQGIDGRGQTIVIVDPYGSPTITADLQKFDAAFGLPAPPSFRVIQPAGPVRPFTPTNNRLDSALETTLDVEWAHAIAPAASIVLAETPAAEIEGATGFAQIVQAEQYVIRHHLGGIISMSFGATEETFQSKAQLLGFRSAFELAAEPAYRVTLVAATGDEGAAGYTYSTKTIYRTRVVGWPASDPLVTAVGGTQLSLAGDGSRVSPDVAWSDSGGGLSSVFTRPAYQDGFVSQPMRAIPDISMDASPLSPAAIYIGLAQQHWQPAAGTSLATPLFAGIVALADQVAGHPLGLINPALYAMAKAHDRGIVDVVAGNNTFSSGQGSARITVPGFAAGPGYDMVTGLGTVDARYFVPELAAAAR
jgi:subtilase family serine protease